jgi:outer membrane protein assembly factor BamB
MIIGTAHAQSKQGTNYHLIWEKRFDKEIKGCSFYIDEERVYPKSVIFRDEIIFFDNLGNVINKKGLIYYRKIVDKLRSNVIDSFPINSSVYQSRLGKYLGTLFDYRQTEKHEVVESAFQVINDRGQEIWRRDKPLALFDEPIDILVSDYDGSIAVIHTQYGGIYSIHGDEERKIAEAPYESRGIFSEDGEYFAAMFREKSLKQSSKGPLNPDLWIALYGKRGEELWRRELKDVSYGVHLDISSQGKFIVATGRKAGPVTGPEASTMTSLFNKNGGVILLKGSELVHLSSFSGDSRFLALSEVVKERNVMVFETSTGREIYTHKFSERPVKLFLSDDGSLLVVETHKVIKSQERNIDLYRRNDAKIFVYDVNTGNLVWSDKFLGEVFGMTPALKSISGNAAQLAFGFENRLAIYGK